MTASTIRKISILLSETNSTRSSGNLLVIPPDSDYDIDINITTIHDYEPLNKSNPGDSRFKNGENAIIIGIYEIGKMNTVEGHIGSKIYKTLEQVTMDWNILSNSIKNTIITNSSIDIS